uniref:Zinc finger GRF-type domain-containing protein n=1 Tax=Oryza punctata TaxID=4537 RepID=A0A0E0KC13_ORYPU
MSQGSHSLGRPDESSGLPLICCPKYGDDVVECKSWKNGGRVFFKCKKNEEYDPNRCSFFKWIEDYKKMVIGMDVLSKGREACMSEYAGDLKMKEKLGDKVVGDRRMDPMFDVEAKLEKLMNLVQLLVMTNVVIVVVVFLGVLVMLVK